MKTFEIEVTLGDEIFDIRILDTDSGLAIFVL